MEPLEQVGDSDVDYVQAYRDLKAKQPLSDPRAIPESHAFENWRDWFSENMDYAVTLAYVEKEKKHLHELFGEGELTRIEHVGSTSIPGMPGMLIPDLILYVKTFPPTNETFRKLINAGFVWKGLSPHVNKEDDDLMFGKRDDSTPKDGVSQMGTGLHVVPQNFTRLDPIVKFRDLAKSNPQILEEYKRTKLEVFRNQTSADALDFYKYKRGKNQLLNTEVLSTNTLEAKTEFKGQDLDQFRLFKN